MRRTILVIAFLILLTVPASAVQPMVAYLGDITSIAWMEDDILNITLANGSNNRSTVTISTDTWDNRWRPVFEDKTVTIPGRTIVTVKIEPSTPRRNENINVVISESRRSVEVPVQKETMFGTASYIVSANTKISFKIDLGFMYDVPRLESLKVDDFYTIVGSRSRGPIDVELFEGGLKYNRSRNTIEFSNPEVVLSMRTPQTNGLEVITFSLTKVYDSYRRNEEEVPGPTILVYGRNYRVSSTVLPGQSDGSTRIPR